MSIIDKLSYYTWNIGFIETSSVSLVKSDIQRVKVNWIKHSYKDRFFADPFILTVDDKAIKVLVEDFPYYHKEGVISLLTIDRGSFQLLDKKVILRKPFHMSYPFIMRKGDGEIWIAPEASQSGKLFYYTMNSQTGMLENQRVLVDEPLLDSTVTEYNGKWWLFCTKRGYDSNRKLFIYYSDTPEGPWRSHEKNPVITDDKMARPAGYFVKDGESLYRVIQKCDVSYGEAVNVSRIITLTTSVFEETFVKELKVEGNDYSYGLHTLNGLGKITVVDGLKKEFAPFRRILFEVINKLTR